MERCPWAEMSTQMCEYHDTEWGTHLHEDDRLFEYLILDCFQAGLSWAIVLKKREALRLAFEDFDIRRVAQFDAEKVENLMQDAGIIRNRRKIEAAIGNAQAVLQLQEEFGSLDSYLWGFTEGKTITNLWTDLKEIPPYSVVAEKMSADLKRRGFRFVGPTIVYSVMQSIGMVNDHLVSCFRHAQLVASA